MAEPTGPEEPEVEIEIDPRERALQEALIEAYRGLTYKSSGVFAKADAERYHRALADYVAYLNRNGGASDTLVQTLEWWNAKRGVV